MFTSLINQHIHYIHHIQLDMFCGDRITIVNLLLFPMPNLALALILICPCPRGGERASLGTIQCQVLRTFQSPRRHPALVLEMLWKSGMSEEDGLRSGLSTAQQLMGALRVSVCRVVVAKLISVSRRCVW